MEKIGIGEGRSKSVGEGSGQHSAKSLMQRSEGDLGKVACVVRGFGIIIGDIPLWKLDFAL
jgi:hypothetical protein